MVRDDAPEHTDLLPEEIAARAAPGGASRLLGRLFHRRAGELEADLNLGIHLQHERDADDLQLPVAVVDGRLAGDGVDVPGLGDLHGKLDALGHPVENQAAGGLADAVGRHGQVAEAVALLEKVEQVVRLIRSKGVGVYFVTQNPIDVPDKVLAQLGNRVQHALRAFTPRDQKAVKTAAETLRANPAFDAAAAITELGVGEALVSFLDEKGRPTWSSAA